MRLGRITRAEWLTIAAILLILAALLIPVLMPRPMNWKRVLVGPLRLEGVALEVAVRRLDAEMRRRGRLGIPDVEWENDALRSRRVSLMTEGEQPLRDILVRLEQSATVRIETAPSCGTCGGPAGGSVLRIGEGQSFALDSAAEKQP